MILSNVKQALRVKNIAYDDEIIGLISACKIDLNIAGIQVVEENEPLTSQAIILYCKANFGYDDNADKFSRAYESLKTAMALSGNYKAVQDV